MAAIADADAGKFTAEDKKKNLKTCEDETDRKKS